MRDIVLVGLCVVITICDYTAYIPQIVKIIKTKKSEDISISSWLLWWISLHC